MVGDVGDGEIQGWLKMAGDKPTDGKIAGGTYGDKKRRLSGGWYEIRHR